MEQRRIKAASQVEKLLNFAVKYLWMEQLDVVDARNKLMELFNLQAPAKKQMEIRVEKNPSVILKPLVDYAVESGLLPDSTTTSKDLFEARVMGHLLPRPSEVDRKFKEIRKQHSVKEATRAFCDFSKAAHYIRMDRIRHNQHWQVQTNYGKLDITINLSKPEKDPREIEALQAAPTLHYPACVLCLENVGYPGRVDHPARQNLRVIPLQLADESWYFQFSPYMYYEEHSIIFHEQHIPMRIDQQTFQALFDFVDQFPHYFIGSNADLPIVGGSILHHNHFQAGRHTFPMVQAPAASAYIHQRFPEVEITRLKWPLTVLRTRSKDREALADFANHVLDAWRNYRDEGVGILPGTKEDSMIKKHNTITPIARKTRDGYYELDLALRNNRTSEEHPEGVFHPHRELHAIKKENIGLIEVMGLAVLPGRLKDELNLAAKLLGSKNALDSLREIGENKADPLHKHHAWLTDLFDQYGNDLTPLKVLDLLREEVGHAFASVLEHCGVFKWDKEGNSSFSKWMESIGAKMK